MHGSPHQASCNATVGNVPPYSRSSNRIADVTCTGRPSSSANARLYMYATSNAVGSHQSRKNPRCSRTGRWMFHAIVANHTQQKTTTTPIGCSGGPTTSSQPLPQAGTPYGDRPTAPPHLGCGLRERRDIGPGIVRLGHDTERGGQPRHGYVLAKAGTYIGIAAGMTVDIRTGLSTAASAVKQPQEQEKQPIG